MGYHASFDLTVQFSSFVKLNKSIVSNISFHECKSQFCETSMINMAEVEIRNKILGGLQDQLHWYSDGPANVEMALVH